MLVFYVLDQHRVAPDGKQKPFENFEVRLQCLHIVGVVGGHEHAISFGKIRSSDNNGAFNT